TSSREDLRVGSLAVAGRVCSEESGGGGYTDEWAGHNHLPKKGRRRAPVCHTPGEREGARGDDGEGGGEGQENPLEGLWTELRNFLRQFREFTKYLFLFNTL